METSLSHTETNIHKPQTFNQLYFIIDFTRRFSCWHSLFKTLKVHKKGHDPKLAHPHPETDWFCNLWFKLFPSRLIGKQKEQKRFFSDAVKVQKFICHDRRKRL